MTGIGTNISKSLVEHMTSLDVSFNEDTSKHILETFLAASPAAGQQYEQNRTEFY